MPFDPGGIQLTGGAFLAALLYAGVSMVITGPLVGERTIETMDWAGRCAAHIHAEVEAEQPEAPLVPKLGCDALFGTLFGREGAAFCAVHGDVFNNNPLIGSLEATDNARREIQRKRMDYAASRAGSRCECAVTTTLENRRVPLAIYAGSARLITPPSIRLLESDLETSLNSPACAMKG